MSNRKVPKVADTISLNLNQSQAEMLMLVLQLDAGGCTQLLERDNLDDVMKEKIATRLIVVKGIVDQIASKASRAQLGIRDDNNTTERNG